MCLYVCPLRNNMDITLDILVLRIEAEVLPLPCSFVPVHWSIDHCISCSIPPRIFSSSIPHLIQVFKWFSYYMSKDIILAFVISLRYFYVSELEYVYTLL